MGDANHIRTLRDYSKPSHEGYRNTIELPEGNNMVRAVNELNVQRTIDQSAGGKLCDRNAKESWALLEDLSLYENESWNNPRDFATPVKAISLPQDVPSTSDRHLIEIKNQVQRLMEAHLAPMLPTQVNKITTLCEICSYPHDTQYCMEDPEQAFVEYASSQTNETGSRHYQTKLEKALIDFDSHQEKSLSSLRTQLGQQQDDMISKINILSKVVSKKLNDAPIRDTAGNPATQMNFTSINDSMREELRGKGIKSPSKLLSLKYLSQSSLAEQNRNPSSPKRVLFVNPIVILNKEDETKEEGNVKTSTTEYKDHEMTMESVEEFEEETEDEIEEEEEDSPKHFDTFPTMKELRYHEWLLKNPRPPWVKAKDRTRNLNNVNFSCMIGHFDKKKAYLDMESPINVMSRLHYNWIMNKRLGPRRKPSKPRKICNFVGRVKGLKVFVGNFTYECDFMVLEDTTSVIDYDLGLVIFGKSFVEATGLVYDREEGTNTFEKDKEKIVFKMPHKMEMFKHIDFTDIKTNRIPPFTIEKHAKSVYLRNDEDKRRGVEYVMSKILGFYKECLELGPEYVTGIDDEGEVTFQSDEIVEDDLTSYRMFSPLLKQTRGDSDHAGYLDSRKSTSGGIQFISGDKLFSWSSKKQDCTSMSSAEAEYVSLSACCAQVLWLRTQLTDYGFHFDKIPMYCDSKATIAISCNPIHHSCTRHIDVRYHFIKEQVEKGIVKLFFVGTKYQLADLFTKALSEDRFKYLFRRLGMRCLTPDELEVLATNLLDLSNINL
ncbi:hypothetical protein Tco_0167939 [Tanacetum coccineum]